ncbi:MULTISPECIES: hypothetical protein [unclassified Nonomuraea]|uniref:hypothetical protein n=1 Tax=unclassified Nonomuraea TaxID=2593643 RepID=UPI0033DC1CF0
MICSLRRLMLALLAAAGVLFLSAPAALAAAPASAMTGPSVQDPAGVFRFSASDAHVEPGEVVTLTVRYTNKLGTTATAADFDYLALPLLAGFISPICGGPDSGLPNICAAEGVEGGVTFVTIPAAETRTVAWSVTVPQTTTPGTDLTFTPVVVTDAPLLGLPNVYSVPPLTIHVT